MLHSDSIVLQPAQANTSNEIVPLFIESWPGKADSNRALLIVHGLGEHNGRYQHVPEYLGTEFRQIYAMDQRGHGRSGGLRGYAPNFDCFIEDIKRVAAEVASREQGRKLYLYAHSFGGLVALSYLLKERQTPFVGAIVSAPLLGITVKVPSYKKMLGEVLGRTLSRVQLRNEINPSLLSHDPRVVEAYVKDRLVHDKITPRLYLDMTTAMGWVNTQAGPLACPTLFLIPGDDRVVDSKKTLEFFRQLKYREKDVREYPGMFHEPHNETEKEKVFGDIKQWLKQH